MNKEEIEYIVINTKDGIKKQAQLISKFTIEGFGDYVIYKLEDEYYAAKYEFDGQNTKLDNNLSEYEQQVLNEIFSKINENN